MTKLDNINILIKEKIKNFTNKIQSDDIGTVISIVDGIALIFGLDHAILNELIIFPHDIKGMVMDLNTDYVSVALFEKEYLIKEGDIVKRTNKIIEVPVGNNILGRVINALGIPLDDLPPIQATQYRSIEKNAKNIMEMEQIKIPLITGIKVIDAIIPIGQGQRELIIGDHQTGKTSIAIDIIINQKDKNVKCIYVAIGQKNSSIISIYQKLKKYEALDYTTIINASADVSPLYQYIAPFSAMTMAEYWLDNGEDVLVVFDDLSKHAVAYRTISLLLKRPSGREAYPGDIFYLHARLLERACKINQKYGGGSITALPIVETQANDISGYIPTNIISITDGQIFLVSDYFNAGIRPAIDTNLSISRIGGDAQFPIMKQIAKTLKTQLANYHELSAFSRFGSDLNKETQKILKHGAILTEILKQKQHDLYPLTKQIIELYAVKSGYFDDVNPAKIPIIMEKYYSYISLNYQNIIQTLEKEKTMMPIIERELIKTIDNFIAQNNNLFL